MRDKFETFFDHLARGLYRNPRTVLLLTFLLVGILASRITTLTIDTSTEGNLREDDPIRVEYNAFRDQFGRDDIIIIAVIVPDAFDPVFLKRLQALHADIEKEVPYLRRVTSLANAISIRGEKDMVIVEELLKDWPERDIDLSSLKELVLRNPLYLNNVVSQDGRLAAVVIETEPWGGLAYGSPFQAAPSEEEPSSGADRDEERRYLSDQENREIIEAVSRVMERYRRPDFSMALSGVPVIVDAYNRCVLKDMIHCGGLGLLAGIFFPTLLFRRTSGIILPMIVINAAMATTFGTMALASIPISLSTGVLPAFLLAVCIGDSVHVLAIFYRCLEQGNTKEDAIAYALSHSGLPIVMTTLTTAAGLLSFSFAELTPIADLGLVGATGVFMALLFTIVLLPALVALAPIKEEASSGEASSGRIATSRTMDRVLLGFAKFSTAHPWKIIGASLVMLAVSIVLILQLEFSFDLAGYFPDRLPVKQDLTLIDRKLQGLVPFEVIVDTRNKDGVYDPKVLKGIEELSRAVEGIQVKGAPVGKVSSINDLLKQMNQALHGDNPAFYRLPGDRPAVAQQLLLLESSGSEHMERIVDSEYQKARITVRTPWFDAVHAGELIRQIGHRFRAVFHEEADLCLTGIGAIVARTVPATLNSMAKSYVIAFVVVSVMMIVLIGDLKIGLLSMLPNLLPIFLTMGCVRLAQVPVDFNILMIGSIAMGLVVDDTLHFMYNFRKYHQITGDAYQGIQQTMLGTGRAMLITSLILFTGFLTGITGTLTLLVTFGIFASLTIMLALLADFLLAPALLILVTRGGTIGSREANTFNMPSPGRRGGETPVCDLEEAGRFGGES